MLVIFHLTPDSLQKLCLAENTKIAFSAEHSFCGSQIVKALSRDAFQNTHFPPLKKGEFWFSPLPAEPPMFIALQTKIDIFPKQIVKTKMPFFHLPNTNRVLQLSKTCQFQQSSFCPPTPKNTIFLGVLCNFAFQFFFFSVCLSPT